MVPEYLSGRNANFLDGRASRPDYQRITGRISAAKLDHKCFFTEEKVALSLKGTK